MKEIKAEINHSLYHYSDISHSYNEVGILTDRLGQLGSQMYFKNLKCQNKSRENDLFQLLFIYSHSQWVRSLHAIQLVFGSNALKLFNLGQTFLVAFHKLPTISWVNFVPFLLTELV